MWEQMMRSQVLEKSSQFKAKWNCIEKRVSVCPRCFCESDEYDRWFEKYPDSNLKPKRIICRRCIYAKSRDKELLKIYGISRERYYDMLHAQDYKCAICRKSCLELTYSLVIDHCHKTGETRGLLCAGCNSLVGVVENDNFETAISYVKYYTQVSSQENDKLLLKGK